MKCLGYISGYSFDRGFGFIEPYVYTNEMNELSLCFYGSDCSFNPEKRGAVIFEVEDFNDTIFDLCLYHVRAIRVKRLTEDFDFILENWLKYDDIFRDVIFDALNEEFYNDLNLRLRLNDIANSKSIIDEPRLKRWLSTLPERVIIVDSIYVDSCKKIIDEILSKEIETNYIDFDYLLTDTMPSKSEIENAITLFINNESPNIIYTHTSESGYWYTKWKWDGSEDSFCDPVSKSDFKSKNVFSIKNFVVDFSFSKSSSGDYDKDLLKFNDVIIDVYSSLKNSRYIRGSVIHRYDWERKKILGKTASEIYSNVRVSILNAILEYCSISLPTYGKSIYKGIEDFFSFKIPVEKDIPWVSCVDRKFLYENSLELRRYCYSSCVDILNKKSSSASGINIESLEVGKIIKGGMLLSNDETILYSLKDIDLQEVVIPITVKRVEDSAFIRCENLKKVHFLGSITYIGHNVFRQNTEIEILGDFSNLEYIGFNKSLSKLIIKDEVRTIKDWSYLFNKSIIDNTKITIKKFHIEHDDK